MFQLDQLQSMMDRINSSANDLFSVPVSVTQIQYRTGEVWISYTQGGEPHQMSLPVDQNAVVDSQFIYNVETALVRAIRSVMPSGPTLA